MFRVHALVAALVLTLVAVPEALAHEKFDHAPPAFTPQPIPNSAFQATPAGKWELIGSIPTGNPHTDLDFFTRGENTYASVGTLGTGPNGGGQTIVQLTDRGEVRPRRVGQAPTASCVSDPSAALGLQHDVEATPKGKAILNTFNPYAATGDTQLLVDASDAAGRCHDQGVGGLVGAPRGGLEILDVADPANPQTLALTTHIGQAHTVNIDPKRPHIAYVATSDAVSVNAAGRRENEIPGDNDQFDLDGFEIVDLSSCMNFSADTPLAVRRQQCQPSVYRYRWPTAEMATGHDDKSFVYGCHELELYPDDRLACGGGSALMTFDMSGAFDDNGTPDDFADDRPRGTPLPCNRRPSSTPNTRPLPSFFTDAQVTDCHKGGPNGTIDLSVPAWLAAGAPSLEGVRPLGSVHHQGGHPSTLTDQNIRYDATQDLAFNHESELTQSGNFLLATDERGGGVTPPGATCTQGRDNVMGNGGVVAFPVGRLHDGGPRPSAEEQENIAKTSQGGKAIYRAPVRTGAQATVCTAHVMQQVPGQNRIFMGWYSQGTQVVDFTENADGTLDFKEVGSFIPASANQWTSHVFKAQENPDGTFTYWGAAADFALGERGRNTIDIYRVTLPPAPLPADGPGVVGRRRGGSGGGGAAPSTRSGAPRCVATNALRGTRVAPRGRKLRVGLRTTSPARVDIFRQSRGRAITGERPVARYRKRSTAFTWPAKRMRDGFFVARVTTLTGSGVREERRFAVRRVSGRFRRVARYERRTRCGLLRQFKLERPVFGGRTNRALNLAFRLARPARVTVTVRRRDGSVTKQFGARSYQAGLHRLRMTVNRGVPRGVYRVELVAVADGQTVRATLRSRRL